jgi:hypothetical protein
MNASAKTIPASSVPSHLGRRFFTEYHLYREPKKGERPELKAEFQDRGAALEVLDTVRARAVGDETYFLVRTTFEVIA